MGPFQKNTFQVPIAAAPSKSNGCLHIKDSFWQKGFLSGPRAGDGTRCPRHRFALWFKWKAWFTKVLLSTLAKTTLHFQQPKWENIKKRCRYINVSGRHASPQLVQCLWRLRLRLYLMFQRREQSARAQMRRRLKERLEAAQRATFSTHICTHNIRRGRNAWNCSLSIDNNENFQPSLNALLNQH